MDTTGHVLRARSSHSSGPLMRALPLALIVATTALLTGAARSASAQCNGGATCTLAVTATATINSVARLSISSSTTTLTTPTAADFGASGGVNSNGPTITVLANAGYTLTASPATANWSGPATSSKPATDLRMKVGTGSVVPLGQVGQASIGTTGTPYAISYNTLYNWTTDKPGNYSLVVNYTLVAP